jgi:hypothetical protein
MADSLPIHDPADNDRDVSKADPRSSQTAPYATLVDAQAVSAGFVTAILSI